MARFCQRCYDANISHRDVSARFCFPCAAMKAVDSGAQAAQKAVGAAIRRGELPPASTLDCADCSKPARCYDHRDYGKPLDVQPVCRSCNRRRGPARPVLTFELP